MKTYIKYKRIEIIAYSTAALFLIVATFFSNSYGRISSDVISHSNHKIGMIRGWMHKSISRKKLFALPTTVPSTFEHPVSI